MKPPGVRDQRGTLKAASGRPAPRVAVTVRAPPPDRPPTAAKTGPERAAVTVRTPPFAGTMRTGRVRSTCVPLAPSAKRRAGASSEKSPSARFIAASSAMSSVLAGPNRGQAPWADRSAPSAVMRRAPSWTTSRSTAPRTWPSERSPVDRRPALRATGPAASNAAPRPPRVRRLLDRVTPRPATVAVSKDAAVTRAGPSARQLKPRASRANTVAASLADTDRPEAFAGPVRDAARRLASLRPSRVKASIQPVVLPSKARRAIAPAAWVAPNRSRSPVRVASIVAFPSPRRVLRSG